MINVIEPASYISKKEIIAATVWMLERLIEPGCCDNMRLDIKFSTKQVRKTFGKYTTTYGFASSDPLGDRAYSIVVRNSCSPKKDTDVHTLLTTLAHELVHIKQYYKGELNPYEFIWKGKLIPKDTPYREQPWEAEAFQMQNGLVNDYIRHLEATKSTNPRVVDEQCYRYNNALKICGL